MQKKFKVTFIGAGSIGFTRGLLADLLAVPEFQHIDIAFMDINPRNLDMVYQLCQRDIEANGLDIRIQTTLDRREALKDAKYVIDCARIGLLDAFELDVNIPLKYGVDQCVGDTLCAGGIMYAQRDIAMLSEMCRDIREVAAPGCMLLNYTNPNAMVTWYCNKYGGVPTVGLCHGVQGGHALIARALGYKQEEIDIVCAGINHMTWYLSVKHNGEELNGKLLDALMADPEIAQTEKVRIDMMKRFGYFSTESNGHLSEYVAWYRKRPDEIRRWIDLGVWINGETGGYLRVCTEGRNWFETDFPNWLKEPPKTFAQDKRSHEHGSWIIESIETGRVYRGHFNVINNGCITNLPNDCVVEVPGFVDTFGINIPVLGDLPLGCAACCQSNITVQRLAMEAAAAGDIALLRQAMMMDPLVGAVCNTEEIWQMVDEMLIAQAEWLPQYADEIERAKARWAKAEAEGTLIPPIMTEGAARLHTKTVEEMAADKEAARKNAAEADKAKERPSEKKIFTTGRYTIHREGRRRMNIFVEGLQGTGKTTLLSRLSEKLPQLPVYREGDVCPVELAWCAYLTPQAFHEAKRKYPALADEMDALAHAEGERIILPYTRVHGSDDFFANMEGHEIYNGRVPLMQFREIILHRYAAHSGEGLFECAFLQNIVETLLLYYCLDENRVIAFYREAWPFLQDKDSVVLYLDAADIARNIDTARRERVDEQGREVWYAMLMDFFRASPLAQQRGWTSSEHLLEYLRFRQRIERRILTEVVGDAAILLPEKQYEIEKVLQGLCDR